MTAAGELLRDLARDLMDLSALCEKAARETEGDKGGTGWDLKDVVDFSQRDPLWAKQRYSPSGSGLFGQYGCLVTALTSLGAFAGYAVTPPGFAKKIGDAGAFAGNFLNHPSKVSAAYPRLKWRYDKFIGGQYSSFVDWRRRPADMEVLAELLARQPVIVEVDFNEVTPAVDQHFVLGLAYQADLDGGIDDELMVMDPWTGKRGNVLTDYFNPRWIRDGSMLSGQTKVSRTVLGLRVWEVVKDGVV
jgi:hypothetical protein